MNRKRCYARSVPVDKPLKELARSKPLDVLSGASRPCCHDQLRAAEEFVPARLASRHHRRASRTPIKNATTSDWTGASRVAALIWSNHVERGATSSARSWDMLRIASTAWSSRCSALSIDGMASSFVMKA